MHGSVVGGRPTWAAQKPLSERFELVVLERPGFPPNPPVERVDFEHDAALVAGLLRRGDHLVGHSSGGVISLLAAAARPDHPASLTVIEPPANLSELAQGRRVVQVHAELVEDASIPSVRAYMILSTLAELGETLACRPAPDDVETFKGTDIVAWLVSDRTDAELAEAAASVAEVADAQATEAVPDAAVDTPEEAAPEAAKVAAEPAKAAAGGAR